ncbi:MAG TPA: VPDSG-CTERM sorting domain-containing protein, partial [Verrucomicrobiae bacterium]|nr:VPDSG-CTERM sorting domain-containing protein [Verrucomicrobiae bacterium]
IDPFHFSSTTPLNYTVVSLANAPKQDPFSATGMGGAEALTIERLWAAHYSSGMSADNAATLQLAIWDVVGGTDFSTTSSLNSTAESWISTVNANGYNGAAADLVGLTGSGQDYVVQNVPDGGTTILLLGSACFGVALLRSRIRHANHVCGNE